MNTLTTPLSATDLKFYQDHGYVVVRGLIPPEEVAELKEEYLRLVKVTEEENNGAKRGKMIQRAGMASTHGELWQSKPYLQKIVAVGRELMGPDIGFWYDQIILKPAGNPAATPWHQDAGYWNGLEGAVTSWLALTEVTENHGCMQFIPGTHKEGLARHEDATAHSQIRDALEVKVDESRAVKVTMQPGDVSFHHPLTLHYTTGNSATTPRCGLINHLASRKALQEKNLG